jgi:hypothetical protein
MRLNLPKLQEMPSVHLALAWLLPDHADGEILEAARARNVSMTLEHLVS